MTFTKYFVAIRHESDLLTPLVESPLVNFSLREMAYLGIFGLSAIFAAIGVIPVLIAALTFPCLILAFFKWRGEIPEMYLYYIIISVKKPAKKRPKPRHTPSDVVGYGDSETTYTTDQTPETLQKIKFSDESVPIDMTLNVGESHRYETVTVSINDTKIVCDRTNSAGQITITIMPKRGERQFTVRDSNDHTIVAKTVEFYDT